MNNNNWKISKKEYLINILFIVLMLFAISRLFYGTFVIGVMLLPVGIPMMKQRKRLMYNKKQRQLGIQFKDMLISMADAMNTGYSVENAIRSSYKEMLLVYGYGSKICVELRMIISRLKLNVTAEIAIEDFAVRSDLEDARMFSQIFSIARRTGGNMSEIIRNVADNIVLKENVKEDIDVAVSAKRLEQRIMTVVPIFLMLYVTIASPGFLNIMYTSILGRIVMTVCLGLYVIAFMWSERITEFQM